MGHGGLSQGELAAEGVGREVKARTALEDVQAVHAGIHIRKAVKSGDLFSISVTGMRKAAKGLLDQDDYVGDEHPLQRQYKQSYWDSFMESATRKYRSKSQGETRGQNRAQGTKPGTGTDRPPPMLKSTTAEGKLHVAGPTGFRKAHNVPADVSKALQDPNGAQFYIQTWENAMGDEDEEQNPLDDDLSMWPPKQEPPSGTQDHRISATLTTTAYAARAKANGDANGHANGGGEANGGSIGALKSKGKGKKANTKDLLDQAFGPAP